MAISESSIMSKLQDYTKTDAGRKKMDDIIQSYIKGSDPRVRSTGKTYGGGRIITKKQMTQAAKEFLAILRTTAASSGLPASVMDHIESFDYSEPYEAPDGSMGIMIYMTDNPSRASLKPKKFPQGVDNIVMLLNTGYEASGETSGPWHGHWVRSMPKREGLWFMQKAVDEFEVRYGTKYSVTVVLNPEYDGAFSGN